MKRLSLLFACALGLAGIGCSSEKPQVIPNSEPALNKKRTELAADAAKRFPYKADATNGGDAKGRCQVGYSMNVIEISNQSDADWNNVELWVNKAYVVYLPVLKAHANKVTTIPFQAIFNEKGQSFPTDNNKVLVDKVEVYYGGTMYNVHKQMAD